MSVNLSNVDESPTNNNKGTKKPTKTKKLSQKITKLIRDVDIFDKLLNITKEYNNNAQVLFQLQRLHQYLSTLDSSDLTISKLSFNVVPDQLEDKKRHSKTKKNATATPKGYIPLEVTLFIPKDGDCNPVHLITTTVSKVKDMKGAQKPRSVEEFVEKLIQIKSI